MIYTHQISERKACNALKLPRSSFYYKPVKKQDDSYIEKLNELTQKHVNIGFWQSYYRIRKAGDNINHKKL